MRSCVLLINGAGWSAPAFWAIGTELFQHNLDGRSQVFGLHIPGFFSSWILSSFTLEFRIFDRGWDSTDPWLTSWLREFL